MKNDEDNFQADEIINPEQFQVGRSPQEEKEVQQQSAQQTSDAGYTAQEDQFADGKGTRLNAEIAPDREEIEQELSQQIEGTFEDQEFGEDPSDLNQQEQ